MPNRSYIQIILNAFSFMDIEKLRKHLKDNYSYEDTSKKIFLNEIERLFKRHQNAGDINSLFMKERAQMIIVMIEGTGLSVIVPETILTLYLLQRRTILKIFFSVTSSNQMSG